MESSAADKLAPLVEPAGSTLLLLLEVVEEEDAWW
jgi:hypothetical protein